MATFFSTDQRGLTGGAVGDMSFHHHYPMASYQETSGGGLIPLPASIAHIAQDEAAAFMGARADNGQPADSSGAGDLQTQLLMGGDPAAQRRLHQHHQGGGGGLSLSLGTQVPGVSLYHHQQYRPGAMASPMSQPAMAMAMAARQQQHQGSVYVHNSRFLKAARELLDEVVSVRDAIVERKKKKKKTSKEEEECDRDAASKAKEQDKESHEENSSAAPELSLADRQEVQNKVTALMGMLDQVDRRYRQYQREMQAVAASLDAAAGPGAARPYTALALQTISRHFRSLRDAIGAQAQAARRSLGEDAAASSGGLSRLRYIDQHLRQQRALQQFGGMMQQQPQQHAWRPQRGLPESAVSVLRAWLFEHFLHPYPKDSEKVMLARQAGLSRGQVSNWFINARVRLWKPMVEEMYKEEFGAEMDSTNSSSDNNNNKQQAGGKAHDDDDQLEDRDEFQSPTSAAAQAQAQAQAQMLITNPYKSEPVGAAMEGTYALLQGPGGGLLDALAHHGGGDDGRFMAYGGDMGGVGGGSVSLTLGLQHCNNNKSTSSSNNRNNNNGAEHEQQGLLYGNPGDFDFLSDDRQRFGSSSAAAAQLLHDFVT